MNVRFATDSRVYVQSALQETKVCLKNAFCKIAGMILQTCSNDYGSQYYLGIGFIRNLLLKFIIPADYIKNVVIVYQSSCEYSLSKILVSYCRLIILSLLRLKILAQIYYTIFVFILQYFPLKFSFLFLKVQESAVCGTF